MKTKAIILLLLLCSTAHGSAYDTLMTERFRLQEAKRDKEEHSLRYQRHLADLLAYSDSETEIGIATLAVQWIKMQIAELELQIEATSECAYLAGSAADPCAAIQGYLFWEQYYLDEDRAQLERQYSQSLQTRIYEREIRISQIIVCRNLVCGS